MTTPWETPLRLSAEAFAEYRLKVIFDGFKWDPQVGDVETIADHALLLKPEAWEELRGLAEALDRELSEAAERVWRHPETFKQLGMPRVLRRCLEGRCRAGGQATERPGGLSLRRYDFHFTGDGWRISEVNADVPGGFAEASILPRLAVAAGLGGEPVGDLIGSLVCTLKERLADRPSGVVALVHATAFSDDRQVMAALESALEAAGMEAVPAGPDQLDWSAAPPFKARLDGKPVAAILRFFPVEWLPALGRKVPWRHYLGGAEVVPLLCNPGAAVIEQSKRLPLVWRRLGIALPTWDALLPETTAPDATERDPDWLHKPAYGRVGDGVFGTAWTDPRALRKLRRHVRWNRSQWVRQRRFGTLPLDCGGRAQYPCLGVFVLDGRCAGIYARTSAHPLIDHSAVDVPVLLPVATTAGRIPQKIP